MFKLNIKYNIINTSEEKLNLAQRHKGINCPDSTKQHRKQQCEVRTDSGQNKTETHRESTIELPYIRILLFPSST